MCPMEYDEKIDEFFMFLSHFISKVRVSKVRG